MGCRVTKKISKSVTFLLTHLLKRFRFYVMNDLTSLTEKKIIRVNPPVHCRVKALAKILSKEEGQNVTNGKVVQKAVELLEKKVGK